MAVLQNLAGVSPIGLLIRAAVAVLSTWLGYLLYRGVQVRMLFRRMKKQGIPMMPHHPVFGHLPTVGKYMTALPGDAHGNYLQLELQSHWRELFPGLDRCPPVFYVDIWPFAAPMIMSLDPDVSAQFTQTVSLVKARQQKDYMRPLSGNRDLTSYEGPLWKVWRKRLNPGFSPQQITTRIPELVEEVQVFVEKLRKRAGTEKGQWGPVFQLQEIATKLTLDVIGRFVLGERLHEQEGELTPLSSGLLTMLPLLRFYKGPKYVLEFLNPWYHWALWSSSRAMTNFLAPRIQRRLDVLVPSLSESGSDSRTASGKTVLDLSIRTLADEKAEELAANPAADRHITAGHDFIANTIGNINLFYFAGHDTTATTICWTLHLLERNPPILARLRAELDAVFGVEARSADAVAARLRENPTLLNGLVYTGAVVRETLRIYTNVGTIRRGNSGFVLRAPVDGEAMVFPTDGFLLWDATYTIHMDPELWHRVDEAVPERWLFGDEEGGAGREGVEKKSVNGAAGLTTKGQTGHDQEESELLRPPKNAWRPFAMGPRNCIGQYLAMTEVKLVLAMICREFDIECAWEEWDRVRGYKGPPDMIYGDRCYQTNVEGPPHVKDGMPVHVRIRPLEN